MFQIYIEFVGDLYFLQYDSFLAQLSTWYLYSKLCLGRLAGSTKDMADGYTKYCGESHCSFIVEEISNLTKSRRYENIKLLIILRNNFSSFMQEEGYIFLSKKDIQLNLYNIFSIFIFNELYLLA